MATITFSDEMHNQIQRGITYNESIAQEGTYSDDSMMRIMKGTVPTDFTGLQSLSARAEDVLIEWSVDNNVFDDADIVVTDYIAAVGTGTATWFWWGAVEETYGDPDAMSVQMIGTVDTQNADLVVGSTSIVEGKFYRVTGLKFLVPQSYTY